MTKQDRIEPKGPKGGLALVELIHRAPPDRAKDCGVTFAVQNDISLFSGVKGDRQFTPLATIAQQELRTYFPDIAEHLIEDSYFSINSYYIPRKRPRWSQHPDLGHLPFPEHGKKKLRQINACFADLDTYNVKGLEPEYALAEVQRLVRLGVLPQPSLFLDSGRGLWPVWLLRDNRNESYSPPAFDSIVALSERVNKELTRRLVDLGADRQATDAVRFLRVAGSRNSKAKDERRVAYWIPLDQHQRAYRYSLDELVEFLEIQRPQRSRASTELLNATDAARKRRGMSGAIGRWAKELHRFELLREVRAEAVGVPAFPKGQRGRALRFYAGLLVRVRNDARNHPDLMKEELRTIAQMSDNDIRRDVRALIAECAHVPEDPIRRADADSAVRSALDSGGMGGDFNATAQTIADWFNITPEEARRLPKSNREPFPHARSMGSQAEGERAVSRRADATSKRRDLLRVSLAQMGEIPTLREMRDALKAVGLECSERTLMKDLSALGISNPRGRSAKREAKERKLDEAAPLFAERGSEPRSEPFRTVPNLNNPTP